MECLEALWRSPDSYPGRKPVALHIRSSKWFILSSVAVAIFTDIFLYAVVVPVIPFALHSRVGIEDFDEVQSWVSVLLAVYGAALLVGSPIFGWVADKTASRRAPLLFGLVLLGGATILLCLGSTITILVVARILQGFAAAVVWTTGLALLVDTVGQKDIAYMMGYIMSALSVAVLLGPLLGGVVYHSAGYYQVYAMCFAFLAVDIFLRVVLIEKKIAIKWADPIEPVKQKDDDEKDADIENTAAQAPPTHPETDPSPPAAQLPPPKITLDPSSSTRPRKLRLPPVITMLTSRRLLSALWGCLVQSALITAFDALLPLRVRQTFGWSSLGAGLIYLPIVLPSFFAPLIGRACDRYGPRYLSALGFVLVAPAVVLLRLVTHHSVGQIALMCALLFCVGFSVNLAFAPLLAEVTYCVEAKERRQPGVFGKKGAYAQAYGLFNMAFAAGCLVGPLWGGLVKAKAGWGTVTWSLALLAGVSAVPSVLWTGGWIFKEDSISGWKRKKVAAPEAKPEKEDLDVSTDYRGGNECNDHDDDEIRGEDRS